MTRAPAIVSHGPAMTRPIMISRKPARSAGTWPAVLARRAVHDEEAQLGQAGQQREHPPGRAAAAGSPGGLTPSGEIVTRRSASRAATAAAAGMPTATSRMSGRVSDRSAGKNGAPVNGMAASGGRSRKNSPKPTATPAAAATVDSTADDHRDLPGRRADQAHRGEPLLAAGGGQPGGRRR